MAIQLRPMAYSDIPLGMKLSTLAGWNQVESDWRMIIEASQGGCFTAVIDGVDVGTVTTVVYPPHVGWIGMVLVDPDYRRRGVGTRLVEAVLEASPSRSLNALWLDATPQGEKVYSKMGFQPVFSLVRVLRQPQLFQAPASVGVRHLDEADLAQIFHVDNEVFGANRTAVLRALWRDHPRFARGVFHENEFAAFCFGRRGRQYNHIGPLVAKEGQAAQELLRDLLNKQADRGLILDVPTEAAGWIEWLASCGFSIQRPFTRMVFGTQNLEINLNSYFAAAGPELG